MFCLEQKHTLTTELQGDSGTSVTRACLAPVCTCRKQAQGKDNILCSKIFLYSNEFAIHQNGLFWYNWYRGQFSLGQARLAKIERVM